MVSYGYPALLRSPTQGFARSATRDGNRGHSRSPRPARCHGNADVIRSKLRRADRIERLGSPQRVEAGWAAARRAPVAQSAKRTARPGRRRWVDAHGRAGSSRFDDV